MNINGNEQQDYTLEYYTGAADFNVIAINPTNKQAKELKLYVRDEDVETDYRIYDKEDEAKVVGCTIVVHLQHKDKDVNMRTTARYRITLKKSYSEKTGKYQYVNNKGQAQWRESEEDLTEKFKAAGNIRVALQGEASFLKLLTAFFDVKGDDSCAISMDDYNNKLFKNDFSDFHRLIAGYPKNKVKYLCGVRSYINNDGEEKIVQGVVDSLPLRVYAKLDDEYTKSNIEYYLENTDSDYLLDIGQEPYNLEIWSPSVNLGGEPFDKGDDVLNTTAEETSGW